MLIFINIGLVVCIEVNYYLKHIIYVFLILHIKFRGQFRGMKQNFLMDVWMDPVMIYLALYIILHKVNIFMCNIFMNELFYFRIQLEFHFGSCLVHITYQ